MTRATRALRATNLLLVWAVAKLAALYAHVFAPGEYSDTYYYFLQAEKIATTGSSLAAMVPEYPTPAAALLMTPWWLGAHDYEAYRLGFIVVITLFDLVFVAALARWTGAVGVLAWVLVETLSGRLALLRFDLVPAVLAGLAILALLQGRAGRAGPIVALGTAVKAWPIVLLPLALGQRRPSGQRRAALVGFALVGVVATALSVGWGGVARLTTPLSFQAGRGLQIESVAASWPMFERLGGGAYQIAFTQWNAYEIAGGVSDAALAATTPAALVGVALVGALFVRWYRAGSPLPAVGYLGLLAITVFMVTSKALSPQYVLWIAAPASVLVGLAFRLAGRSARVYQEGTDAQRAAVLSYGLVALVTALTVWVYPGHYDQILWDNDPRAVGVLIARNALLVGYAAFLARQVWRRTRRA